MFREIETTAKLSFRGGSKNLKALMEGRTTPGDFIRTVSMRVNYEVYMELHDIKVEVDQDLAHIARAVSSDGAKMFLHFVGEAPGELGDDRKRISTTSASIRGVIIFEGSTISQKKFEWIDKGTKLHTIKVDPGEPSMPISPRDTKTLAGGYIVPGASGEKFGKPIMKRMVRQRIKARHFMRKFNSHWSPIIIRRIRNATKRAAYRIGRE